MISRKLDTLLLQMEKSGDSQQLGVADCLRTIASNGGEQATDEFIAGCAALMAEAAKNVRDQLADLRTPDNRLVSCQDWQASGWQYSDWQDEVAVGATRLGFVDWLWHTRGEREDCDGEEGDVGDTQS